MFAVAGRARFAALLTVLVGGAGSAAPPIALVTPNGSTALAEISKGGAARDATWNAAQPGLEWTELNLSGRGEARRIRVIATRLDPAHFRLSLENGMAPGGFLNVWTLDMAPSGAALALNAGMFAGDGAWGWVVHDGNEYRVPGTGPLARAVVVDTSGAVRLLDDEGVRAVRADKAVREAFQSYPALLDNGELPTMLTTPDGEIDLQHRDARLAIGLDDRGGLIIALTRFDVLGPSFGSIPFGLTIPETGLLMRALGAESAVALDGGISAQLMLRDALGEAHRWDGLRPVPLGLSAVSVGSR
ncbi:MAG TPA: phosphodiester glycosidase family protein [Gemmatimonadales bacterium]|nr:phosphodiester glycosidase family protein [Gemmatimonadales bacterium]